MAGKLRVLSQKGDDPFDLGDPIQLKEAMEVFNRHLENKTASAFRSLGNGTHERVTELNPDDETILIPAIVGG